VWLMLKQREVAPVGHLERRQGLDEEVLGGLERVDVLVHRVHRVKDGIDGLLMRQQYMQQSKAVLDGASAEVLGAGKPRLAAAQEIVEQRRSITPAKQDSRRAHNQQTALTSRRAWDRRTAAKTGLSGKRQIKGGKKP